MLPCEKVSSTASEADEREPARPVPLQFGKYRLSRLLARGGMGEVYLARLMGELGFEKLLVIKTILPELAAKKRFIELFAAEAKTAVALQHGNIVPTYELGRSNDTFYIVMGYVDGPSVAQLLGVCREEGRTPDLPVAMHIIRGVLAGLAYAHQEEPGRPAVVHRDITPRNILLDRSGQVRIVDFGIAAPAQTEGVRAGSTGYVAPEQARGEAPDPRADVFSVACLLYELCTFKRAFPKRGVWVSPDFDLLPEGLRGPLRKALSFDPDDRPRDAAALVQLLRPVIFEHASSFDDQTLAAFLRELFPGGHGHASERSGLNPIRGFEGENETFATRLTAVTNISKETPVAPEEPEEQPAGSGARLEPASKADEGSSRLPLAAVVLGAIGIGGLAVLFSGGSSDDAPGLTTAASQRRKALEDPPAKRSPAVGTPGPKEGADTAEPDVRDSAANPDAVVNATNPGAVDTATPVEPPQRYTIQIDPPDAELRVDGRRQPGKGPFQITVPKGETVALEARKPGYEPKKIKLADGDAAPSKLTLTKLKPKEPGFLRVTAPGVSWAEVRLDGRKVGTTPTQKLKVPSGRHRIEIKCIPDACAEPRVLLSRTVTIDAGQTRLVKPGG